MKLRIVAGMLKGRVITIPERDQDFRPTRERIREAVAAILTQHINGARVADICAGSGAFGLEMLSRGARHVVFIDNNRFRAGLIKKHAEQFGVTGRYTIFHQEVVKFINKCTDRFDIIYFDPPYDDPVFETYLPLLQSLLSPGGILVYEHRANSSYSHEPTVPDNSSIEIRSYGETEIYIFRNRQFPNHENNHV